MSGDFNNSLDISHWLANIKTDDIDGGLAADFDGSLSGLGMELGSSTYNMSEALMALPVFKHEAINQGTFQYILVAATSPATKLYEETLTYLNQGQSYELKMKKTVDSGTVRSHIVRSVVRVVFHDRRLQFTEQEQLSAWKQLRQGERILDTDVPLAYGAADVKSNPDVNEIEFTWDQSKDAGVYLKVNCISTEFTAKKHGGEKGVPFRIQVETYTNEGKNSKMVHAASCQIKVFKPKGADRKHKTDRTWIERRSETEKAKYQPSYECTVLIEVPLDQVKAYLDHKKTQKVSNGNSSPTFTSAIIRNNSEEWSISVGTPTSNAGVESEKDEPEVPPVEKRKSKSSNIKPDRSPESDSSPDLGSDPEQPQQPLFSNTTAQQVSQWLHKQRFSNYVRTFQNFSGADLLRLSREDLIQICGLADGIRLNNAIHYRAVRPHLKIYVYQDIKADWTGRAPTLSQRPKSDEFNPPLGATKISPSPPKRNQQTSPNKAPPTSVSLFTLLQQSSGFKSKRRSSPSPPSSTSPASAPDVDSDKSDKRTPSPKPLYTDMPALTKDTMNLSMATSSVSSAVTSTSLSSNIVSCGQRKPKRQYGEHDDGATDEGMFTKKQRTRSLELYPKCVYHAVYLDELSLLHLQERLATLFSIPTCQISQVCVHGPSGIPILVTDSVVQNLVDESRYSIEGIREDDCTEAQYIIMLKSDSSKLDPSIS